MLHFKLQTLSLLKILISGVFVDDYLYLYNNDIFVINFKIKIFIYCHNIL